MWTLRVDGPSWAVEFGDNPPGDAGTVLGATQAAIAQGLTDGIYDLQPTTIGGVLAIWREALPPVDAPPPPAQEFVAAEVAPGEVVANPVDPDPIEEPPPADQDTGDGE